MKNSKLTPEQQYYNSAVLANTVAVLTEVLYDKLGTDITGKVGDNNLDRSSIADSLITRINAKLKDKETFK